MASLPELPALIVAAFRRRRLINPRRGRLRLGRAQVQVRLRGFHRGLPEGHGPSRRRSSSRAHSSASSTAAPTGSSCRAATWTSWRRRGACRTAASASSTTASICRRRKRGSRSAHGRSLAAGRLVPWKNFDLAGEHAARRRASGAVSSVRRPRWSAWRRGTSEHLGHRLDQARRNSSRHETPRGKDLPWALAIPSSFFGRWTPL